MIKNVKVLYIFVTVFICCSFSSAEQATKVDSTPLNYKAFEESFEEFNKIISESLDLRIRAINYYSQVKDTILTSQNLNQIHTSALAYAKNREKLLAKAQEHFWYSDERVNFSLVDSKTQKIEDFDSWFDEYVGQVFGSVKTINLELNPNDKEGMLRIKQMKMSLVSALTLYDNFILAIMPYEKNKKLRRLLNDDNTELDNLIEEISGNFRKIDNYKRALRVTEYIHEIIKWEKNNPESVLSKNSYNHYLNELIIGSYTYNRIAKITVFDRINFRLKRFANILKDDIFKFGQESMNLVSMGFGNTVGLIQSRSGKMKRVALSEEKEIKEQLYPLDVLLEKTPFRLTDKFIPGHWGHVAIWIGNEEQLKNLGVWKELDALYEYVKEVNGYKGPSFKDAIRAGNHIVEALRPGVQLNSMRHFLDIDDLAVIRTKLPPSLEEQQFYIKKAFLQIGKEYDFNFDVQTDKKIVCSELAYVVFEDYEWPVERQAGRYTISPDHVAVKAKSGGSFEPVLVYHDGDKIEKAVQRNYDFLLDQKYDEIEHKKGPF